MLLLPVRQPNVQLRKHTQDEPILKNIDLGIYTSNNVPNILHLYLTKQCYLAHLKKAKNVLDIGKTKLSLLLTRNKLNGEINNEDSKESSFPHPCCLSIVINGINVLRIVTESKKKLKEKLKWIILSILNNSESVRLTLHITTRYKLASDSR